MSAFIEILNEDIDAIISAFDEEDYTSMNMFSNRFMSNVIMMEGDVNILPGFIYKDISLNFRRLKSLRIDTIALANAECKPILVKIKDFFNDAERKPTDLWTVYLEYFLKIREYMLKEVEKSTYNINYEYTRLSFNWLINYLNDNKNVLHNENNLFLNGILNEMDRIIRCHSGQLRDIITVSLIRSLEFLEKYLRFVSAEKEMKKIYPYLEEIVNLHKEEGINSEESLTLLKRILVDWREYFIKYMEVRVKRQFQIERPIELPEDVKQKISESISKTLEDEIR